MCKETIMKIYLQNLEDIDRVLNITLNAAPVGFIMVNSNEQIKHSVKNQSISLSAARMR